MFDLSSIASLLMFNNVLNLFTPEHYLSPPPEAVGMAFIRGRAPKYKKGSAIESYINYRDGQKRP